MANDRTEKDEERLDSFLNLLFGIDSGAMVFFLWFVRGDVLGVAQLPFQLAFLPFKPNVLMLGICALCILLQRGLNLFWHDKPCWKQFSKWSAFALLVASICAIGLGGWQLIQNPEFLPDGKKY